MNASRLSLLVPIVLILAASPAFLSGQKKEDFLQLSRDVAQMQADIKQLQKSQDDKMAALTGLVQQAIEASHQTAPALAALQKNLSDSMRDQQSTLVAPLAKMNAKVDDTYNEVGGLRQSVDALIGRLAALDGKLRDISDSVRTLSAPPPAPSAVVAPAPSTPSSESAFTEAKQDYIVGHDDLAMKELTAYLQTFPGSEHAADALYYIGELYDKADQNDEALKAFNMVLERYPDSPRAADAMYHKAVELQKLKRNADAVVAYKEFVGKYPNHDAAPTAEKRINTLKPPASKKSAPKAH